MALQKAQLTRTARRTGLIMLAPLFGQAFIKGWNWHWVGFVFVGALLFFVGLIYELVAARMNNRAYRLAVGLAVTTSFIHFWGSRIRQSETENPANLLYFGVPLVCAIGTLLARFQPRGMARALYATALAHLLVPAVLFLAWDVRPHPNPEVGIAGIVVIAGMFLASAFLFRRAAADNQGVQRPISGFSTKA